MATANRPRIATASRIHTMQDFFMPRARAIALLVDTRERLLATLDEHPKTDIPRLREAADGLERLMLDVRAGRVSDFYLEHQQPEPIHVRISAN